MVNIRSKGEIELMKKSGVIAARALKKAIEEIKPGVSAAQIDKIAGDWMQKDGGDWSYKTVPDYRWPTCITVNEQVVHGIPTERAIQEGDLVSVDLAVMYQGWHTDCAWTVFVGGGGSEVGEKKRFLAVGEEALWLGIKQAVAGNTIGDISAAIQGKVEGEGYHVVRSLVGHGVGKKLHEEPEVPGYGKAGKGLVLQEGMSLAIEVIYAQGTSEVVLDEDDWTYSSADGSLSALFEMTVIVGKERAEVLTDWRKS